jgi:type IV pilus assembly protein PilC
MKYTYLAKTQDGSVTKGSLESSSQKSAEDALEKQGLTPISVRLTSNSKSIFAIINEKTTLVPLKDKMLFARQLSTLISAGVPISQAIQILKDQTTNKKLLAAVSEIADDVEGGIQLSEAFGKHPKIFSTLFVNMLKAGEVGGSLDESLQRMATEMEIEAKLLSQIKGAMYYPIGILVLTIGVLIFMIMYLIPQMTGIFESLGGEMPPSMKNLIALSGFFKNWGIIVLILIIAGIYGLRVMLAKNQKLRLVWHKILLKLPLLGTTIQKVNISRFTRTLSSLLSSGVTVIEAMQVAADSLKNEVYVGEINSAIAKVKNGSSISEALKESKYFPKVVYQTIAVGEETGSTDKILIKLTEFYEEEVSNFTRGVSDLILPVIMVIIGIAVGLMFYTVIVPISEISNTIQ